ncbi:hypothetical protein ACFQHW_01940 [Lapidilactobacillus achengensis]|uniref:Uncharacterized protein n=1 Tax=Lapidilactobacillus achengensis TaxID=2486000 RepID=A0ABW1UN87_9LACO|nr:hypothetical protein [Lapidilactobacillus achengensis]
MAATVNASSKTTDSIFVGSFFDFFLFSHLIAGVAGVARERNRLGLLLRTGTWWASFEANPQSARLVFKSSLVLSGKAAKDNFTTEPRSPSRLLGRIEPICDRSWVSDQVVLQARGQTIALFGMVRQCQLIPEEWALFLNL